MGGILIWLICMMRGGALLMGGRGIFLVARMFLVPLDIRGEGEWRG